jgi:hypothetical protein
MTQTTNWTGSWKRIAVIALVVIYIGLNLFQIGGDAAFVSALNNWVAIPLAVGVTVLSWLLWRQTKSQKGGQIIWLSLAIGWTLWTIAEIWWVIAGYITEEIPYPSGADFFWLLGYIPLYFALWRRLRSLPKVSGPAPRAALWLILLAVLTGLFFLVFWPTLLESGTSTLVENATSLLYPVATAILLILALQIMFAYQQGKYGRVWQWLVAGFVLLGIVDIFFAYAINMDLYYPEGRVNLLSAIGIDTAYNMGYLAWLVGLVAMRNIVAVYRPVAAEVPELRLVPNTHIYLFAQEGVGVTSASQNYTGLYGDKGTEGKSISEALGLAPEDELLITDELKTRGLFDERPFTASARFGQKDILLSGVSHLNGDNNYFGAMLLVRALADDDSLDDLMIEYHKGMVRSLLKRTGAGEKQRQEISLLLTGYYHAHLKALYNHAFSEGGSIFAEALITDLQAAAAKQGWPIEIHPDSLDSGALSLPETIKALPALFEIGKQFIVNISGEKRADDIVQRVDVNFDERVLKNVSYFIATEGRYA